MKLADFICFEAIIGKLEAKDRNGAIQELVASLTACGAASKTKVKELADAVIAREDEASTGFGKGIAVPHVKHKSVKKLVATVGNSPDGIDFAALDKKPVYSIILLLSPAEEPEEHLHAMENIFKNLQNDDFRRFLLQATNEKEIGQAIREDAE